MPSIGGEGPEAPVVLITGCSSGFGLLTAARLASTGFQVIATMRNPEKSGALEEELRRRGARADILALDVTDQASVDRAVREIGDRYGEIHVLVNNAGYGIGGFFEDLTEEEIRRQMETNFFGAQRVTRAVIPFMRRQRRGRIINISSVSGFSANPAIGAYSASKWALEAFSESLHYELKFFGIDVLLIEPGTYRTKIFGENARFAVRFHDPHSPYYPASCFLERRVRDYVRDCHKDPEEIAELVERLIRARRPAFRNIPDIESRVLAVLRRLLPFRIYSRMVFRAVFRGFDRKWLD